MVPAELCQKISTWIKEKVQYAKAKGGVFGLSGGLDSAVVAALCKKGLGGNMLAIIMPCGNNPAGVRYAQLVADKFNIKVKTVSLEKTYDSLMSILFHGSKMALANLKPRLRMITLYYFANNLNYLVIGTGNKSELSVGYFTKHGDGGVDILPLGSVLKTEVVELAKYLGVPKAIIDRPPSADLWPGQTDEEEMGITYQDLDQTIRFIEGKAKTKISEEKLAKIKNFIQNSQHKRKSPPIFNNF